VITTVATAPVTIQPSTIRPKQAGLVRDTAAIAGRALRAIPRDLPAVIPPVFIALFFFVVNIGTLERLTESNIAGFDFKAFMMATAILLGALLYPIGALNRRAPDRGAGDDESMDRVSFGALPVARKDLDRLRHLLLTIPRLTDPALPPRVARGLPHRPSFGDAVTWLEIFGDDPDLAAHWKHVRAANPPRQSQSRDHGHAHRPAHKPHAHGPDHPPE